MSYNGTLADKHYRTNLFFSGTHPPTRWYIWNFIHNHKRPTPHTIFVRVYIFKKKEGKYGKWHRYLILSGTLYTMCVTRTRQQSTHHAIISLIHWWLFSQWFQCFSILGLLVPITLCHFPTFFICSHWFKHIHVAPMPFVWLHKPNKQTNKK